MSIASMAVRAEAARYIKRKHNAVAFLDAGHRISRFFDDTHNLVTYDSVFFERRSSVIHVKVTTANAARSDAQQSVCG